MTGPVRRTVLAKQGCGTAETNKLWINLDGCGLFTAVLTQGLQAFGTYVTLVQVVNPWLGGTTAGTCINVSFLVLYFLAMSSHLRAMLSDPGCVPQDARPVDPDHYRHTCSKCDAFKPLRAHHCRICNRCVVKMDHHCPWVNNCVGLANQKFFLLFVGYTMLMSLTALGLLVVRLATCTRAQCGHTSVGFMVSLIVEAVLFGLFTLCMLCDQLNSIFTNTTGIDRLKGHNTNASTNVWANLAEVFGGEDTDGFSLLWLLPTRIHYPDPEALTGFCFRDTPRPKSWVEMETLVDPADLV